MIDREALAFDMYGALVDPLGIRRQLERDLSGDALRVAEIWRQKQLEYTFRLTAMGRYGDFAAVTRNALAYALAAAGRDLDPAREDALLAGYNDLGPSADVRPGLQRLRAAGHAMVVFSNGTPAAAPDRAPGPGCASGGPASCGATRRTGQIGHSAGGLEYAVVVARRDGIGAAPPRSRTGTRADSCRTLVVRQY